MPHPVSEPKRIVERKKKKILNLWVRAGPQIDVEIIIQHLLVYISVSYSSIKKRCNVCKFVLGQY